MPSAKEVINETIKLEGGYSNDPSDSGGETMYGITIAVARANGYTRAMKDMPRDVAYAIYYNEYLIKPRFSQVESDAIMAELFDTGVNMGQSVAGKFLQRSLNVLTDQKLVVDGNVGPVTLAAVNAYLKSRANAESILLKALNCLQGARYIELVEAAAKNKKFINGWIANRINI